MPAAKTERLSPFVFGINRRILNVHNLSFECGTAEQRGPTGPNRIADQQFLELHAVPERGAIMVEPVLRIAQGDDCLLGPAQTCDRLQQRGEYRAELSA